MKVVAALVRAYLSLFVWIASNRAHARSEHELIVWSIEEAYREARDGGRAASVALGAAIATHLGELQPLALFRKTVTDQQAAVQPGHIRVDRIAIAGTAFLIVGAGVWTFQSGLGSTEGLHLVAEARAEDDDRRGPPSTRGPYRTHEEALGAGQVLVMPASAAADGPKVDPRPAGAEHQKPTSEPAQYCVVRISPLAADKAHSDLATPVCFETLGSAIFETNEVTVQFGRRRRIDDIIEALGTSTRGTVIGVSFAEPRFLDGGTLIWISEFGGCANGLTFAAARMPAGWDDVISSTVALGGCDTVTHYESVEFAGTRIDCTCDAMILMHDLTSSIRWSR